MKYYSMSTVLHQSKTLCWIFLDTLQPAKVAYNGKHDFTSEKGVRMDHRIPRIVRILLMVGILAMFVLCNGGWPFSGTRSLCSDEQPV